MRHVQIKATENGGLEIWFQKDAFIDVIHEYKAEDLQSVGSDIQQWLKQEILP